MATFLTTLSTSATLEQIINSASYSLTIVSPYLKVSRLLRERIIEASSRGVRIKIIYGKKENIEQETSDMLSSLRRLELLYCDNLHAKCYFNDDTMIITSMNLYEFSEKNNREIGVLIKKDEDRQIFEDAIKEIASIEKIAERINIQETLGNNRRYPTNDNYNNRNKYQQNQGTCIRCNFHITLDPRTPYCKNCYNTWVQFGNANYEESYCHGCGKTYPTSMNRPLCSQCSKTYR